MLPVILLVAKNKRFSFWTVFVLLPSEQMQFDASKLSSWRKWTNERMWLFLCDLTNPTLASTLSLQAVFSANLFVGRRCFATLYPVLPYRLLSYPPPSLPSPTLQSSKQPGTAATVDLALTSPRARRQADDTLVSGDLLFARLLASLCGTALCPPVSSFI